MGRFIVIALIVLSALSLPLNARGTVNTTELLATFAKSNPSLVKTLQAAFELDETAVGVTIGRAVNPNLAGTRVGPYKLHGYSKCGDKTPVTISLETEPLYLDAEGHKTDAVSKASSLTELLKSFKVEVGK